jgi:DNA-binding transcriptional LysR family regulator
MDRFAELSIFLSVVENGSFSAAARALMLSPSAVSKAIARQEARLSVRLFNRNSRSLRPTLEGSALYESGLAVREALEAAEASVSSSGVVPAGLLRIHTMPMLAKYRIAPLLPEFLRRYPQVRLEFQLSIDRPDPVQSGVDVIVRLGNWPGGNLIARRIGSGRRFVCASPAYLREHGTPRVPEDLLRHNCLVRRDIHDWTFGCPDGPCNLHVTGNIVTNESELLLTLTRAGLGIMRFSEHVVEADLAAGTLVRLLPEFEAETELPIYAAYLNRRHLNPRIRAFVDYLGDQFLAAGSGEVRRPEVHDNAHGGSRAV